MGRVGTGGNDREVCGLWSVGHPNIGRTHLKVL